jgi:PAS domain S-box-containing protein
MEKSIIDCIVKKHLVPHTEYTYGYADMRGLLPDTYAQYPYAIAIGKKLQDDIIDELYDGPTLRYFQHYHQVNAELQKLGENIQNNLYQEHKTSLLIEPTISTGSVEYEKYIENLSYDVSHKMIATRAGLGWIGKTDLLVSKSFGPRLRLVSILISEDPGIASQPIETSLCGSCNICVEMCPAQAANGKSWNIHVHRDLFFNAFKCREKCGELAKIKLNTHERICGLCVYACPKGRKKNQNSDPRFLENCGKKDFQSPSGKELVALSKKYNSVKSLYEKDIAERRLIEEALREREKNYRVIFELITDYVFKLKVAENGSVFFDSVSDNFHSITGRNKEDIVTVDTWADFICPEDYVRIAELLKEMTREPLFCQMDCRSKAKDGKQRWVHIASRSEWKDMENRITAIYGAVRDITEQKDAEREVKEKNEEIEAQNKEYQLLNEELLRINNELTLAKEKAEESDRLKTSFLQNMSHEIRTPMNAIMGFSSLLVGFYNDRHKIEKFAEIINNRCNDLLGIINDILDISKIESGQYTVNYERCNLQDLMIEINEFFQEHQLRIGKENILFSMKLPDPFQVLEIITDKVKLKQILINLINNAFKFTTRGSIEFGCALNSGRELQFYVSDTGRGIPKDNHQMIFERFTQVSRKDEASSGTGLGLPIVKGLLDILGGHIWLESTCEDQQKGFPGNTLFYFTLPCQDNPSEPILYTEQVHFDFKNKKILAVEDDPFHVELLREVLAETGIHYLHTTSGMEAVDIAVSENPDIILMDIRLKDINGYEAIEKIKLRNPAAKIIVQTTYAGNDDRKKAYDMGCNEYISKPIDGRLLLSAINRQLYAK